jgi:hypothetical protein
MPSENQRLPHLKFDAFFEPRPYTYPRRFGTPFSRAQQDRAIHGNAMRQQLNSIRDQFGIAEDEPLPANILRDNALYVEFYSEFDFPLKFDSLNQERDDPQFKLLSIKEETAREDGQDKKRFRVVVMMKEGGVSAFIRKVTAYINENTTDRDGNLTDKPKNADLFDNIASIQLATLESFWTDSPEVAFPAIDDMVWWEVWFRRTSDDGPRLERVFHNLREIQAQIGIQTLEFPEHRVRLVRASARQLSSSLLLLDNLAELRKPQEINDFVAHRNVDYTTKQEWLDDLLRRIESHIDGDSVVICLLDSGVNNRHPLVQPFLPDNRMFTYKESWNTNDSWPGGGHGTGMAGLALYGDLVNTMASQERIRIFHGLESFKIIHPNDPNDPNFYGALTEFACSSPVASFPDNMRVFCLSVTDSEFPYYGRPSSWSSAIDKIAFGNNFEPQFPQLITLSSGNVDYVTSAATPDQYPSKNILESIHDPSQAYNALVVGSYTRMDRIDRSLWPGVSPLAPSGGMSPSNPTSLTWESQWPIKPDVVLEGGNLGVQSGQIRDDVHSLMPLSIDKDFRGYIFYPFGDTSGAAALCAKMEAEVIHRYPKLWPETIRGLIVHSAEWTSTMLNGISLERANTATKRDLLRRFGHGVPILDKALFSAGNALTLIAENTIQPYRIDGGSVKYNQYHLYKIPWPTDVLQGYLGDSDVKLIVTLSYYVEPNPGNRHYANSFQYYSHSLDFRVIKPTEDEAAFRRRVSAAVDEDEDPTYEGSDEPWALNIRARSKGSLKKDFIVSSGADLATRNVLAIYPKGGWYRTRKKLGKFDSNVRYSLIVSIETDNLDVDIYTPVSIQLPVPITIDI